MLVLRLLVMVLSIIFLMDGHAEVSSSTTVIRNGGEIPAVKTHEPEVQIFDRKKKKPKKPKKAKKKKDKKTKPKKKNPPKPVTTTPPMVTSTLKTTTISTTPAVTRTASPATTAPKTETTTTTTTSSATTTIATTETTTETTISVKTTASSALMTTTAIPTTAATVANSGGECKATNGKPCIFPFNDGSKDYNECKNHGGTYFWCATAVYDSGKYKHWSYCPNDGSCPIEGDEECRATNNKPCVFPFKDGKKEYNECADFGGKYFWCATGTNSAGKYTSWSECPEDGSCPLLGKSTTPMMTSAATILSTTLPTNDTSAAASAIANVENTLNDINDVLQNLETAGLTEDEKHLLDTMTDLSEYLKTGSLMRFSYDSFQINSWSQQLYSSTANIKATKQVSPGFYKNYQTKQNTCSIAAHNAKLSQANARAGRMFHLHTISEILGIVTNIPSSSSCCAECKSKASDSELFEHSNYYKQCDCYKTKSGVVPETMFSSTIDSGICPDKGSCSLTRALTFDDCEDGYVEVSNTVRSLELLQNEPTIDGAKYCKNKCEKYQLKECVAYLFESDECNKQYRCQLFKKLSTGGTATTEPKLCLKKCNNQEKLINNNDACLCELNNPYTACPSTAYCVEETTTDINQITTTTRKCIPECKPGQKLTSYTNKLCRCGTNPGKICKENSYCLNGITCQKACKEKVPLADVTKCHCGGQTCLKGQYCTGGACATANCGTDVLNTKEQHGKEGCGCSPDPVLCPVNHVCSKIGCRCKKGAHYSSRDARCDFSQLKFCIYNSDSNGNVELCTKSTFDNDQCYCSPPVNPTDCPHPDYLTKHVRDVNWRNNPPTLAVNRAYWAAIERNFLAARLGNNGEKTQTIVFQATGAQNQYTLEKDGLCNMNAWEPAYECIIDKHTAADYNWLNTAMNNLPQAPPNVCTLMNGNARSRCGHSLVKGGHYVGCI